MPDKKAKKGEATSKNIPNDKNVRQKEKLDFRPFIAFLALVAAIAVALPLNPLRNDESIGDVKESMNIDNGDLKINWQRYPTTEIELEKSLTIQKSGTYHLTGALENGLIKISAGDGIVRLILDNVSINHDDGPVIYCDSANDLVIELVGDNSISDGESYDTEYDEEVGAAIYTQSDLTFQGDGKLTVDANYQDGIVSKDDLKFNGGTYDIVSKDDAIRGTDSVYVVSGNFIIKSTADAIKSTNDIDATKGFVYIENGNFNSKTDAKGIKSTKTVLISDGKIVIESHDDAIHSDNYIAIKGSDININSGDDAIHANSNLIIDGGDITVFRAYEGLEAQKITINQGVISLTTNDDGINAGGGADASSTNRPGANPFDADEECVIDINDGDIYINSSGDGIDSNGWVNINGGHIVVDGPTNNGNGALDSGLGIIINGGDAIAVGSSGMVESFGNNSKINNISIYLDNERPADTKVSIKDDAGETIIEHTSAKKFSSITAGSNQLKLGGTYSLYLNDQKVKDFIISDITTIVGNNRNNFRK